MFEPGKDRAPWEIPPDEGYWRALLEEGEYVEPAAAPDIAEAIAVPRETVQSRSDVPLRSDAPLR
ncbi:MAG: hypothetical protein ACK2VA_14315, partial [Anaerolineae bacterium]